MTMRPPRAPDAGSAAGIGPDARRRSRDRPSRVRATGRPSTAASWATAWSISSAVITRGGASRMVEPWVSLARTPRSISRSQASRPVISAGSMSMPGPQPAAAHRDQALADQQPPAPACSRSPSSAEPALELAGGQQPRPPRWRPRRPAGCRRTSSRARRAAARPSTSAGRGHRRHRHDAAAERLAEQVHVRHDALVLAGEGPARAAQTRLDLVGDEQHVALGAQLAYARAGSRPAAPPRPARPGSAPAAPPRCCRRSPRPARPGRRTARSRSPACTGRSRPRASGSVEKLTMVVVRPWKLSVGDDDVRPAGRDALDPVAPLAGDLDRGLHRLGAGVHRQHQLHAAQLGQLAAEVGEPVVDERAAGQREPVQLGVRGVDQRRVPVAEVERRVAGQQSR